MEDCCGKLNKDYTVGSRMSEANNLLNFEVPTVTVDELKKALKGIRKGEAEDELPRDQIKDAGNSTFNKLTLLYAKCSKSHSGPTASKVNIIMIFTKK